MPQSTTTRPHGLPASYEVNQIRRTPGRMSGKSVLVVALGALGFLLGGWWLGHNWGQIAGNGPGLGPTVSPPPAATPNLSSSSIAPVGPQTTLLLVVVDSLDSPRPALQGCWLITFTPGTQRYFFVGFPPDLVVDDQHRLIDYYRAAHKIGDISQFLAEAIDLASNGDISIQYPIVIDRAVISGVVDQLGGLRLGDELLDGEAVLQRHDAQSADSPQAQLQFQKTALEALAEAVARQTWTDAALTSLLNSYQRYSPDADELLQLARSDLPFENTQIIVQIWQPVR